MLSTLKTIQQQNSELKESFKSLPAPVSSPSSAPNATEKESERAIQEMQAQIKNLKAMILDMKSFPAETASPSVSRQPQKPPPFLNETKPSIPAWQTDSKALSFTPTPPNPNTKTAQPSTPPASSSPPKTPGNRELPC